MFMGFPRVDKKLLLIFIIALVVRLLALSDVPFGFHNDEVDVGYVGKFILLNGRDPAGNILPLAFNKYGDFRPTGLFYLAGISQFIFGSNVFAVRLPTALFGALTVFPVFYLAKILLGGSFGASLTIPKKRSARAGTNPSVNLRLAQASASTKLGTRSSVKATADSVMFLDNGKSTAREINTKAAYLAAFFLAILPWHIVLSRAGHEAVVGYFLITCGLYFLIKYLNGVVFERSKKLLVYAVLLLASSYLFYHGTRLIVPLLLFGVLAVWQRKTVFKMTLLFLILTFLIMVSPLGRGRIMQVVFYKDPGSTNKLRDLPTVDGGNIPVARIFHNKLVVYGRLVGGQYLQYFSPDFLFLRGGYPERYIVPEAGLVYVFMLPFLVFGIVQIARTGGRGKQLAILWLLVSPLPGVLTYDDIPSITRTSFMVIPLVLVSGLGAAALYRKLKQVRFWRVVLAVFVILSFLEIIYFGHEYAIHQKSYKATLRDAGMMELAKYLVHEQSKYDVIVASYQSNLPFYFLFFAGDYRGDIKEDISGGTDRYQRGNVLFLRDDCPALRKYDFDDKKVLYVDQENCQGPTDKSEVIRFIRPDLSVAFKAFIKSARE